MTSEYLDEGPSEFIICYSALPAFQCFPVEKKSSIELDLGKRGLLRANGFSVERAVKLGLTLPIISFEGASEDKVAPVRISAHERSDAASLY